ncbi:hypothetical protein EMPS_08528 [Entomortierella parvispora]|uniref:Thioredoxin domain-containing protein n=1 Tax=Entomortierella parvispora TaxID=205924 RepID=A0A9P3HGA0_9FUNG|nr:hypothetical protein EMPS_08528 [Entomortierella parvispora]
MSATDAAPISKQEQFHEIYLKTLWHPFREQYDEKWQDEPFWAAVEVFKAQVKEIGYDDPLEGLKTYRGKETFEQMRDTLKKGPVASLRPGWKSPLVGQELDVLPILEAIHHVGGTKYEGKERIVLLDFWATWCGPCVELGLELSDISEKHVGKVAIIGINNEGMLGRHPAMYGLEGVKEFMAKKKEHFRYSNYVDNVDEHARDVIYRKTEYLAIPCAVLVVDGKVRFAGNGTKFEEHLDAALKELYPKEA